MITVDSFRTRLKEFNDSSEYSDAELEMAIEETLFEMGEQEDRWLGKYDLAQTYLTAHIVTMRDKMITGDTSSQVGTVTGKSVDGVSVSKTVPDNSDRGIVDEWLMQSAYGQRYLTFRDRCFTPALTAFGTSHLGIRF